MRVPCSALNGVEGLRAAFVFGHVSTEMQSVALRGEEECRRSFARRMSGAVASSQPPRRVSVECAVQDVELLMRSASTSPKEMGGGRLVAVMHSSYAEHFEQWRPTLGNSGALGAPPPLTAPRAPPKWYEAA